VSAPPDFEALYRRNADPWEVGSSAYEQRKLGIVLAALFRPRYTLAWDPACGTGHLAKQLARRCDRVLASDAAPRAVELTQQVCAAEPNVETQVLRLPDAPRDSSFRPDLVVLSEFVYYLDDRDRAAALRVVDEYAAPTAEVLAVHWSHIPDDAWLSGTATQTEIVARLTETDWRPALHHVDEEFMIDTLRRGASTP
jgi:hypothetical protein